MINTSDLEVFLKNSQNTFIKKLLIENRKKENSSDKFSYINCMKEYIMKKRRVKYLAILEISDEKRENLFSLKDIVKEFALYDIQVLSYSDLLIHIDDYIKEID